MIKKIFLAIAVMLMASPLFANNGKCPGATYYRAPRKPNYQYRHAKPYNFNFSFNRGFIDIYIGGPRNRVYVDVFGNLIIVDRFGFVYDRQGRVIGRRYR
jgi:hypothetical protein